MRGYSHALTGTAAWLAVTTTTTYSAATYIPHLTIPATPPVILAGAILCAGAALAPDADHPDGTIAHSLPPISRPLCKGVAAVTGGHRHATHSPIGVLGFYLIAHLAVAAPLIPIHGRTIPLAAGILAVLLTGFAAKSLGIARELGKGKGTLNTLIASPLGPWIIALATAGTATWYLDYAWTWLPECVAVGAAAHMLGDALTPEGVPLLWPLNPPCPKPLRPLLGFAWRPNGYFAIPIMGHTDTRNPTLRETLFSAALAAYSLLLAGLTLTS